MQQTKPQKIKTQLNMSGPIPKNIVSPKTIANKSQGKTKHSQYFNDSEVVINQQYPGQLTPKMSSQMQQ